MDAISMEVDRTRGHATGLEALGRAGQPHAAIGRGLHGLVKYDWEPHRHVPLRRSFSQYHRPQLAC